jgi:hypothetical protein
MEGEKRDERSSQRPGSFGSPKQIPSNELQSFTSPLSSVYGQNASVLVALTGEEDVAEES